MQRQQRGATMMSIAMRVAAACSPRDWLKRVEGNVGRMRTQTPQIREAYVLGRFPNLPGGAQSFRRPECNGQNNGYPLRFQQRRNQSIQPVPRDSDGLRPRILGRKSTHRSCSVNLEYAARNCFEMPLIALIQSILSITTI